MQDAHAHPSPTLGRLVAGLALAVFLTLASFALVWSGDLIGYEALFPLAALAALQIAVHLRYFLHVGAGLDRDVNLSIVFAGVLIVLMVGGTLWIMTNLDMRMMSMASGGH